MKAFGHSVGDGRWLPDHRTLIVRTYQDNGSQANIYYTAPGGTDTAHPFATTLASQNVAQRPRQMGHSSRIGPTRLGRTKSTSSDFQPAASVSSSRRATHPRRSGRAMGACSTSGISAAS